MIGVVSFGSYIPWFRLSRELLRRVWGWLSALPMSGEKAVANYDEDAITMAVEAGMECILCSGVNREAIDGVYFASTSPTFKERSCAEIVATALDLRPDIYIADFTNTTKAGTTALLSAYNAVKAGSAQNILVCASECRSRIAKCGSSYEALFGDAAASVLIGRGDVVAEIKAFHSISYDFPDFWRTYRDDYERAWEDRFIREEAYLKFIPEAISAVLKKAELRPEDISRVCYPALFPREYMTIATNLGFKADQLQPSMLDTIGDTGSAWPIIMLIAALEEARPGDRILMASYGNGSDTILFEVTDGVERIRGKAKSVKSQIESKRYLDNYGKYLVFCEAIHVERGRRAEDTSLTPLTEQWRRRRAILAFVGTKCKKCGLPQFPPQKVCANPDCNAWDAMEPYRFSEKKGTLFSFTEDYLAFCYVPPAIYGIVDFDGGGRWIMDITDVEPGMCKVGMRVRPTFRRKVVDHERGIIIYSWKVTPRLAD